MYKLIFLYTQYVFQQVSGTGLDEEGGDGLLLFKPGGPKEGTQQIPQQKERGFLRGFSGMWEDYLSILRDADR